MQHILDHTLANPKQCRSFGVSWCDNTWDKHRSLGIECEDPDLSILFKMKGSSALFTTRTQQKMKLEIYLMIVSYLLIVIRGILLIQLSPRTINATSNTSAVQKMKEKVPVEGLCVCATMERDTGYIVDGGDQRLLSGISTSLMNETLLPHIVDYIHIANTTSRNRHCDISPESLSKKITKWSQYCS